MELIEGPTLKQRIERGTVSIRELIEISLQVAKALDVVHRLGIIHGDIKPANIFVNKRGGVKVLGFGQPRGDAVDGRSDLFSLGAVMSEMTDAIAAVPIELDRIIARAMAKEPGDRYPTAADLVADLERALRELSGEVPIGRTGEYPTRYFAKPMASSGEPARSRAKPADPPSVWNRITRWWRGSPPTHSE